MRKISCIIHEWDTKTTGYVIVLSDFPKISDIEDYICQYLTCETDFAGLDVTEGSSLVGALRIRLDLT